jgi:serine/threonine protein kinase
VVVIDFVANGSLADHLPDVGNGDLCQLSGSTKIIRIITGIVLTMRFIHSRGIIHGNLTPDIIHLDLDWKVRICDFWHHISTNPANHFKLINSSGMVFWPDVLS